MHSPHLRGPRSLQPRLVKPGCQCGGQTPFDPESAHRALAQKLTQLTGVMASHMQQAPLDRSLRNANAKDMAKIAVRIVGGQIG
ncbi:MAG TPA: hypothetical protein VGO11_12140 [Chthoniobacteraceae bacterium]|jgi:hypothetical protein|nr:hypothetical protein [Chthoniobacteraceae bacterium]